MHISFSPQRRDDLLEISVSGDVLTVNGEAFDFGFVGEGDVLPRDAISSEWFAGPVTRTAGEISLTVILPIQHKASAAARYPQPVSVSSGSVSLPDGAITPAQPVQPGA